MYENCYQYPSHHLVIVFFSLTDVDECLEKKYSCPANSKCVNTVSSYSCACFPGYKMHAKLCRGRECVVSFFQDSIKSIVLNFY